MARTKAVLSKQIFERLQGHIMDRVYAPGDKLAEDEVAAELGVSRTPVREAFRMLEHAGWIQLYPHSGAYVRNPSMEEVRQVFEVRQCLEERAARLAARHATTADTRRLERIVVKGTRLAKRASIKDLTAINAEFHAVIAEAGRNELLARMLADLSKQVRWHFSAVATIRGMGSWTEHQEILRAIVAREEEEAGRLAVEHSRRTQEAYFLQLLRGGGDVSVAT